MDSIDDIFDSSLNLEETHLREGFDEGYEAGIVSGREDARLTGLKFGFETGELIGFYRGCAAVWRSAIRIEPIQFSQQLQKHVKEFEDLLEKFPLRDPENESIDKIKDDLRVKFNMICASLGVAKKGIEYKGYPKLSNELEF